MEKRMKIKLTKKHLKDAVYLDNENCPLAKALKARGYKRVHVGGYTAQAYKNRKKVEFSFEMTASQIFENKPFTVELTLCRNSL
jgi:hypothetical protein